MPLNISQQFVRLTDMCLSLRCDVTTGFDKICGSFISTRTIAYAAWNFNVTIEEFLRKSPNQSHCTLSLKQSCLCGHVSQMSTLWDIVSV